MFWEGEKARVAVSLLGKGDEIQRPGPRSKSQGHLGQVWSAKGGERSGMNDGNGIWVGAMGVQVDVTTHGKDNTIHTIRGRYFVALVPECSTAWCRATTARWGPGGCACCRERASER